MKCIVIDDEPLARKGMLLLIEQVPWLQLSGTFAGVLEADGFLAENPVDLIFLDIQMPKLDGLSYLRSAHVPPQVVITTAYPQFAVEAFDLEVADYLVKPIRFERFYKAVCRVASRLQHAPAERVDDYLFIRTERKYVRTHYDEIDFVEGLKDYVIVHCGNEKHVVAANLKSISESLPSGFLRINKSYIVNMSRVRSVENDTVTIHNRRLPVGENFRKALQEFISQRKVLRR